MNMKNTKRFSSGVIFADIGVDDATGIVEGVTDGGQTGGQTTLTGQVTDQTTMHATMQATMHAEKTPYSNHTYICYH